MPTDRKISALTSGASAMAGTDALPIARSGANYKLTLADLITFIKDNAIVDVFEITDPGGADTFITTFAPTDLAKVIMHVAGQGTHLEFSVTGANEITTTVLVPDGAIVYIYEI